MKTKTLLLLTLLLSGMLVLSACAPEASSEAPQEQPKSEEAAYPASEEQGQEVVAYPVPEVSVGNEAVSQDPYPGVEDEGHSGEWDLSEAILAADFAVMATDKKLQEGPIFIDHYEIVMKESFPVQIDLVLTGNLPTPCNHLRVVAADPDENGHIDIKAYTVIDPDMMCTQVLKPFVAVVPLGEYTEGTYTFSVNGEQSGDFQLP